MAPPRPTKSRGATQVSSNASRIQFFSLLLALQYGAQPLISKRFVRREVIVTSSVLVCELAKVLCALFIMAKDGTLRKAYKEWTLVGALTASGLPAAIYALQNSLLQISYKNLDSLTFSMLNQTKIFFTAFFTYLILRYVPTLQLINISDIFGKTYVFTCVIEDKLNYYLCLLSKWFHSIAVVSVEQTQTKSNLFVGAEVLPVSCGFGWLRQKQSIEQIGALFLLIVAAVLLSVGEGSSKGSSSSNADQILFYGIIPVLVASVLSGLASSLCQWASQVKKHSSYLMTIEMSIVGSVCLLASTFKSPDGEAMRQHGFFYGWTPLTLIPVMLNAFGGILVGLVTSHAGGVRKGFVIVSALLITALLQFVFDGKPPSLYCLVALPVVVTSISIYQKYPYQVKKKES